MKTIIAVFLILVSVNLYGEKQPNVVLIYSDDHGWGDVGYHGFTDIWTPNIDKLAQEGTWFSQGYVSASVCGPSRAGLLTGVYQQRMGVYGNYDKGGIALEQSTVFEMMKGAGYRTAAIGKWHVGGATEAMRPNSRGVDFFYGFLWGSHDYRESTTDFEDPKKHLRPIMRNDRIEPPIQDSNGYLTEMFTDEAVAFIERSAEQPFFLYLAYNAVHHPWDVPQSYIDRVQHLDTHDERKLFAGMVLCMDDGVGAVMDALKQKGIADETLVIFMSDNGSPRGQGIAEPRQKVRGATTMSSPGPFNGFKGDTYEGGIRVPFVMRWPERIPAGNEYKQPVLNLDIVPTMLALNGIDKPEKGVPFDGVNLLPYLNGEQSGRPHETLYWRRDEDYAVRSGDWKLAYNDQAGPKTIRLFNLATDPGEWNDLADVMPERAQALQDLFDAWDSRLPNNQSGRDPRNRNGAYKAGGRVEVAAFNRQVAPEPVAAEHVVEAASVSYAQQLEIAKSNAAMNKREFDKEQFTRWFKAKDLNGDGMIDAEERGQKVPPGWNKE